MDFLKKHYEKLALAVALLLLIGSAVFLAFKVGALSAEIQEAPHRPKPKGKNAASVDLASYTNAIASVNAPALWIDMSVDPFFSQKSERSTQGTNVVSNLPALLGIKRELFKMLFVAYSYNADATEGYNFQLNFQFRPRTFFVTKVSDRVKDPFEDTGYVIAKYDRKTTLVDDPHLGGKREKDLSELTLQHEGEEPIVLVLGLPAEQHEPVATIQCSGAAQPQKVRRGQQFNCAGVTYNVVDITPAHIVILDAKSGEKHIISLPATKE